MKQEVVFVEGVNGVGKDYFLQKAAEYFPNVIPYYAPKNNFTIPINDSFVTFNTLFRSIEMNSGRPSLVYRSPVSELVYDRYFGRDLKGKERLLDLFYEFLNVDLHTSVILYILPNDWEQVCKRRPELDPKVLEKLNRLYLDEFTSLRLDFLYLESFDTLLERLDRQIESLPARSLLMDVDNTYYQYKKGDESVQDAIPVSIWTPTSEDSALCNIFISGREHKELGALTSPFKEIFRSAAAYKYAFIKRLIETTDKKFVMYDDYVEVLERIRKDFDLHIDQVPGHRIWRLCRC